MLKFDFSTFPVLATHRLDLKQMTDKNGNDMFHFRSKKVVMKFIPRPLNTSVNEALELIQLMEEKRHKQEAINWGIFIKNTEKMIGFIGYVRLYPEDHRAEVGYMIDNDYWGKGIVVEALNAVVKYGFEEMKLHTIEAVIDPLNTQSESVLTKAGFKKEGYFKEKHYNNGVFVDAVYYTLFSK